MRQTKHSRFALLRAVQYLKKETKMVCLDYTELRISRCCGTGRTNIFSSTPYFSHQRSLRVPLPFDQVLLEKS